MGKTFRDRKQGFTACITIFTGSHSGHPVYVAFTVPVCDVLTHLKIKKMKSKIFKLSCIILIFMGVIMAAFEHDFSEIAAWTVALNFSIFAFIDEEIIKKLTQKP